MKRIFIYLTILVSLLFSANTFAGGGGKAEQIAGGGGNTEQMSGGQEGHGGQNIGIQFFILTRQFADAIEKYPELYIDLPDELSLEALRGIEGKQIAIADQKYLKKYLKKPGSFLKTLFGSRGNGQVIFPPEAYKVITKMDDHLLYLMSKHKTDNLVDLGLPLNFAYRMQTMKYEIKIKYDPRMLDGWGGPRTLGGKPYTGVNCPPRSDIFWGVSAIKDAKAGPEFMLRFYKIIMMLDDHEKIRQKYFPTLSMGDLSQFFDTRLDVTRIVCIGGVEVTVKRVSPDAEGFIPRINKDFVNKKAYAPNGAIQLGSSEWRKAGEIGGEEGHCIKDTLVLHEALGILGLEPQLSYATSSKICAALKEAGKFPSPDGFSEGYYKYHYDRFRKPGGQFASEYRELKDINEVREAVLPEGYKILMVVDRGEYWVRISRKLNI